MKEQMEEEKLVIDRERAVAEGRDAEAKEEEVRCSQLLPTHTCFVLVLAAQRALRQTLPVSNTNNDLLRCNGVHRQERVQIVRNREQQGALPTLTEYAHCTLPYQDWLLINEQTKLYDN